MHPCHERSVVGQRLRHGNVHVMKLLCGIVEVELVENAVAIVGCQKRPVLLAEGTTLCKEATKIGTVGDFLGREEGVAVGVVAGKCIRRVLCEQHSL